MVIEGLSTSTADVVTFTTLKLSWNNVLKHVASSLDTPPIEGLYSENGIPYARIRSLPTNSLVYIRLDPEFCIQNSLARDVSHPYQAMLLHSTQASLFYHARMTLHNEDKDANLLHAHIQKVLDAPMTFIEEEEYGQAADTAISESVTTAYVADGLVKPLWKAMTEHVEDPFLQRSGHRMLLLHLLEAGPYSIYDLDPFNHLKKVVACHSNCHAVLYAVSLLLVHLQGTILNEDDVLEMETFYHLILFLFEKSRTFLNVNKNCLLALYPLLEQRISLEIQVDVTPLVTLLLLHLDELPDNALFTLYLLWTLPPLFSYLSKTQEVQVAEALSALQVIHGHLIDAALQEALRKTLEHVEKNISDEVFRESKQIGISRGQLTYSTTSLEKSRKGYSSE